MAGIQLSGLTSGLDTEGMITQLMSIERQPRDKLSLKQVALHARQDLLSSINDKLKSLKTAADALSSVATWSATQTVATSDANEASARLVGGAGPGTYTVNVTRLASAEQRTYAYTQSSAAKSVTLNGKNLSIASNSSLDTVVSQINNDTTYGVYAVNVSGKLVLASRSTGAAATINLGTGGSMFAEDTTVRRPGQDAAYTIDGTGYTSPSNVISATTTPGGGIITGVELTLKKADNTPFTVTVGNPQTDKQGVTDKLKAFVDAYNSAMDAMRAAVTDPSVKDASTASDVSKGVLFGDSGLTNLMTKLRQSVSTFTGTTGNTNYDMMYEVGLSTGAASGASTFSKDAVNGKLTIDTAAFGAALDADPLAVQKLLGGVTGTTGFAQSFGTALDPYSQTGGLISGRIDSTGSEIRDNDDRLASMDTRLSQKETSLRQMFTNMELALQKAQSQGQEMLSKLGVSSSGN